MTEYEISGCTITISTEVENERFLEKCTDSLITNVEDIFDKWYSSQGNCEAVYKNAKHVLSMVIQPFLKKGVDILSTQGIYSLDETTFYEKYLHDCADEFYEVLYTMIDQIEQIEGKQQHEKEYRHQRKANRGRVVGGGFGLGGALKGMATAGALNAVAGTSHTLVNLVGNMNSSISANADKKHVYKNSKAALRESLVLSAYHAQAGIRDALLKEAGIRCKFVTADDSNRAEAIYKNYIAGRIPEATKQGQIFEALILNPYNMDLYITIWSDFGDKSGDLRKLCSFFGGNLNDYVAGIAKKYGENLFVKNCGEYEKAFDKRKAAVSIERQIRLTYEALLEYCKNHNIADSDIPTIQKCNILLQEIDIEQRTFNNIIYETRDEAQSVKRDYCIFYDFLQGKNIFENSIFDQVTALTFHSKKFKEHITDVFDNEIKLRTIDLIYSNTFSLLKEYLQKNTLDAGWIDVPHYSNNLSAKEEFIRTANNIPHNEVLIAFFDRSSNGKSGIMISNLYMRIFSNGIFSSENKIYPIESLGRVSCLGNNKYLLEVAERDPVEIDCGKRKLSAEEQISFSKALNALILLVKNLSIDDRQQMYRLLNTFVVCKCGMHLLVGEKICPKCSRMLKENGELVETEICPNCKSIIPVAKKFCNICGNKLLEELTDVNIQAIEHSENEENINKQEIILHQEARTQEKTIGKGMSHEKYDYCVKCGNQILFKNKFCSRCGTPILIPMQPENQNTTMAQMMICPKCNNLIKLGKKFCSKCGTKLQ